MQNSVITSHLLLEFCIDQNNLALGLQLGDIILTMVGEIIQPSFGKLLQLAVNTGADEDILSCARIGQRLGLLTDEVLKKQIFPNLAGLRKRYFRRDVKLNIST